MSRGRWIATGLVLIAGVLVLSGCLPPSEEDLAAVNYIPSPGGDWEVSTPEAEGLNPLLVAELYYNARRWRPSADSWSS